jgi:hypothetical protein
VHHLLREVLWKRDCHHTSTSFWLGVIRRVHKLFKQLLLLCHPKKHSFKMTITQILVTEGWRSCHYYVTPTTTTWYNSHCLPLNNSGTLLPESYDSSVGIALGYGLDDRGSRVWFLVGAGNFSLHHRVQNGSGAHPASYPMGTRGSFPGGKAAGAWSSSFTSI